MEHVESDSLSEADLSTRVAPNKDETSGRQASRLTREQLATVVCFSVSNFAVGALFSLLGPFFPAEAKRKGVSSTMTGLIFSMYEVVMFVMSPIAGYLVPRVGAKFCYAAGLFVAGGATICFGLLDRCPDGAVYVVMCLITRSVAALGASFFVTSSFSVICFRFPERAVSLLGTLELFTGLGLMSGPPIGGALYELGGFAVPFIVAGSVVLVLTVLVFTLLSSPRDELPLSQLSKCEFLAVPIVMIILLGMIGCSGAIGFFDVTLAIQLHERFQLGPFQTSLLFLASTASYTLSAPGWGALADFCPKHSPKFMVIGAIIGGSGLMVQGPSPLLPFIPSDRLWLMGVGQVLLGVGLGTMVISFQLLNEAAKSLGYVESLETFSMISGIFASMFSAGAMFGPFVGGALIDKVHFGWAATIMASLQWSFALLMLLYILHSNVVGSFYRGRRLEDFPGRETRETTPLLGGQ